MSLSVVSTKNLTPQTKAWRAFIQVAQPGAEKKAIMEVATKLYSDGDVEEGATLYSLSQMTLGDFSRKYAISSNESKAIEIVSRAMKFAGLSFKDKALKVA